MTRHYRKYTDAQLIEAVALSTSYAQVIKRLGLVPAGGNYVNVQGYIKKLGLDTAHFLGQRSSGGKVFGPKRPIWDYLNNKCAIQSHCLKMRLIKEGIFKHKCSSCRRTKWLGATIPLELEHKDGNHQNNALENLCLLCPNCHALTPTYRGRNKGRNLKAT